ncbi:MAG: hypothetical protein OEL53_18160 [Rhodospirillales bacterium]|nr:hypothetical protein [Rhodospirillales bacterium]
MTADEIQSLMDEEQVKPKPYRFGTAEHVGGHAIQTKLNHRKYTISALWGDKSDRDAITIGLEIENCSGNKLCRSPFCPRCRYDQQQKAVDEVNTMFGTLQPSQLSFLTVLLPITYRIEDVTLDYIKQVKKQFRNHMATRARHNPSYENVRWYGAFEIDVKRVSDVPSFATKKTLADLGYDLDDKRPAFLPHFHVIVDRGDISRDAFRAGLTENLYPGHRQVRCQELRSDKNYADNLRDLATYMLKFRIQHADNIGTGYAGEKSEYKRTKYTALYETELVRSVVKSVHRLGRFQSLIFRTGSM